MIYRRDKGGDKHNYYGNRTTKLIYFVLGTRPEVIKLYPIIQELKNDRNSFSFKIICTYQQEEMVKQILYDFHIVPDISLKVMKKKQTLSLLSSNLFFQLESVYKDETPDLTIVQGDTTTSLIAALCSFYHKVPVAHIEAGLRTRRIYFPFPEELNRQTISNIATYNFCPTKLSANNLFQEKRETSSVYIVGNTVIDTLKSSIDIIHNNNNVKNTKMIIKSVLSDKSIKHIILLTIHRRENYGSPFANVMKAVYDIIKNYEHIAVIYPLHLNPNVMLCLKQTLPSHILKNILKSKNIDSNSYLHLNRLKIVEPLSYFSLVYLLNQSYIILTDSGGIQEEAVYLQKPILILRNSTERMEGVLCKSAKLVGTNYGNIYHSVEELLINRNVYESMIKNPNIYGNGTAAKQIINILKNNIREETKHFIYDCVIIVVTVWKRNNLLMQLELIKSQSILKWMKASILVYQNYKHITIENELNEWKKNNTNLDVIFVQTGYETGYYGRFLSPLTYSNSDSYFIICDDDILFGSEYFENMLRVVDEGNLATRNGRYIDSNGLEAYTDTFIRGYFTWEEDLKYDFGGHIWAGRIDWLKKAWQHPPPSLLNCEDAWISIVLWKYYNISTKVPKCPLPKIIPYKPSLCACSDLSALSHFQNNERVIIMKKFKEYYNFSGIMERNPDIYLKVKNSKTLQNNSIYHLDDDLMGKRCLFFV